MLKANNRRRRSKNNRKKAEPRQYTFLSKKYVKPAAFIISIAVILFGLKLLSNPMINAVAGFLKESTLTFTSLTGIGEIRQTDGVTNILLVGVDQRSDGGPTLTDTIMLVSYRHDDSAISMVSFPRDLWVTIPAFNEVIEHQTKINGAFSLGEQYAYTSEREGFDNGIGVLTDVVESHIELPIHYYAKINFEGFKQAIDIVGGVDVYVERAFTDYQYPREGYENAPMASRWEVVSFEQGWQHMDGETALKYSRSRHALGPEGSDFARADRQQKVILALKEKIMSNEVLMNLNNLRNLYLTMSAEVDTNIDVAEIPSFYSIFEEIEDISSLHKVVLSTDTSSEGGLLYVPEPAAFGGAFVLLPINGWESIAQYVYEQVYVVSTPTPEIIITPVVN